MLASTYRPSPLRARRLLRGLRLRDVEIATGVSDSQLSALERGDSPLVGHWLRRLAAFYQTPPAQLGAEMERWRTRTRERRTIDTTADETTIDCDPRGGGHAA